MSRHCCIHTDEARPFCCRCDCYTDVAAGDCDEPGDCEDR